MTLAVSRRSSRSLLLALAVAPGCFAACAASSQTPEKPPGIAPSTPPAPPERAPVPLGSIAYGADPVPTLSPLEARAAEAARSRLGGAQLSGSLSAAARILAGRAAERGEARLAGTAVRDALAQAAAWDPAPRAFLARAGAAQLPDVLSRAIEGEPGSAFGVGVVANGDGAVAVVLTAQRNARLDPFPRDVDPGSTAVLSGELRGGLSDPRVFVTLPSGEVQERETAGRRKLRAPIAFPQRGRYVVEVVGKALDGPSVAALLVVSAGGAPLASPAEPAVAEAVDPAQAEDQVVAELAALRARHGLGPVVSSPELAAVARRHSAAMRAAGRVAHEVPGSPGPADRLARAGIAYQRVYENVAAAESALAAHRIAAESPAHRQNMLQPTVTRVGVGIERERLSSGGVRVYLTEILVEPQEDPEASRLTPDGRVREALWQERARLHLPPLTSDAALDELAREGARELLAADVREGAAQRRGPDAPGPPNLTRRALALGRSLAGSDVFVASSPREATRSPNLRDARYRRVGVGVIEGPSHRYGGPRMFIAAVYTD